VEAGRVLLEVATMEEGNTPVADLKREQSDPAAVAENGLDAATTSALDQPTQALNEGKISAIKFTCGLRIGTDSNKCRYHSLQKPHLPQIHPLWTPMHLYLLIL
jgi:hypothetical protein